MEMVSIPGERINDYPVSCQWWHETANRIAAGPACNTDFLLRMNLQQLWM